MNIKTIASSSSGCCYVIEAGGEQLLIDCGVPLRKIKEALDFDLSKIVGCLISHEHGDHCGKDGKTLLEIENKTIIPLYAPKSVVDRFKTFRCQEFNEIFNCGGFAVRPLAMRHDVECYGYIVWHGDDILLYATDTACIPYQLCGITHLMIEANYAFEKLCDSTQHKSVVARVCEGHLDINMAIAFAKTQSKTLKEVHLIHLSDRHSDEGLFQQMMEAETGVPVYVAQKG